MVRAIVKNGRFEPLEPLPASWDDGHQVEVRGIDAESEMTSKEIDAWEGHWNELACQMDADDIKRMHDAIQEADAIAKEQVRREMGL